MARSDTDASVSMVLFDSQCLSGPYPTPMSEALGDLGVGHHLILWSRRRLQTSNNAQTHHGLY